MKILSKITIILTACTINLANADESATVIFTGKAPEEYEKCVQPLTMYACNNTQINLSMKWTEANSKTIPYGPQSKDGKDFFISKYYIASPPLPNSFSPGKPLILGVLYDDHFSLSESDTSRPDMKKRVFMDYTRLKPIKLGFIPVNYSVRENESENCIEQINTIAINIHCPSFKLTKGGTGPGQGIGELSRMCPQHNKGQLFIPLDNKTMKPLEGCTVEIINDIRPEHLVYFGTADNHHEKLDLTQAYKNYKRNGKQVELYCRARRKDEPASGCEPLLTDKNPKGR